MTEVVPGPVGTTSHCARCGALMVCGRDSPGGCWCTGLPALPASALVAEESCLCEKCLREALRELPRASGGAA